MYISVMLMMMVLVKKCQRVHIGCQSLLANISACIMTEKGGEAWVQPIYYPFLMIANHAHGTVLDSKYIGAYYGTEDFEKVPVVDSLAVWNKDEDDLVYFLVNRTGEGQHVLFDSHGFIAKEITESVVLSSEDIKATNYENHKLIEPEASNNYSMEKDGVVVDLKPYSFQMVRIKLQ